MKQPSKRSDFTHFVAIPVRWGDADALGHVNNVQYARYLESGRVAYYEDVLRLRFEPGGSKSFILADLQLSYLQQVHYPCELEIGTRVSRLGRKSLAMDASIFRRDEAEPVLASHSVMVWFDYAANRTEVIPQHVRDALSAYELHSL